MNLIFLYDILLLEPLSTFYLFVNYIFHTACYITFYIYFLLISITLNVLNLLYLFMCWISIKYFIMTNITQSVNHQAHLYKLCWTGCIISLQEKMSRNQFLHCMNPLGRWTRQLKKNLNILISFPVAVYFFNLLPLTNNQSSQKLYNYMQTNLVSKSIFSRSLCNRQRFNFW